MRRYRVTRKGRTGSEVIIAECHYRAKAELKHRDAQNGKEWPYADYSAKLIKADRKQPS